MSAQKCRMLLVHKIESFYNRLSSNSQRNQISESSKYLKKKHHYHVSEDKVETDTITGVSYKLLVQTVKINSHSIIMEPDTG